ncbi:MULTISPECIES: TRAP transporter large permease [unclassified Hydrogenophaga]|uniref:TRAP transporter large permease n=1 Tax=unclassified Hydrogenophaga TaxID=2610897 RepID=UPI0009671C49|nr:MULTISPECIES: TRAP transporter large permease [unclassified Hydrogenophaga]MBN9372800.1 TRAP transporter large permease [Hydrogenophaga sp.]OJV39412.1 MAG: C4-dicarboxylate ABC transporter permease [Hydrogenophaga sp. 70-12]
MNEAMLGFGGLFLLMFLRVPLAFAMGIVGVVGMGFMRGWPAAGASATTEVLDVAKYTLSVVPLFILMGQLVTQAGMSRELFRASFAFFGHRRGGLSLSTLVSCAGFGAICGSSLATVATMARVAMPEMRRYRYADSFAAGTIAAGGTLGILIPPSVILVIYGIMTEQSIGALFAAGLLPGLLAMALYMVAAAVVTARSPELGPPGEHTPWRERWQALRKVWAVLLLFGVVMGGLYGGLFTATEAAGVGAMGGLLFAALRRTLSWGRLIEILGESGRTSAMLFTILIGASLFANFINYTTMPTDLRDAVMDLGLSPLMVVVGICLIYVVLGAAMETLSMILLTVPIFFPLITHMGLDPVWFGVLIVCVAEISLITPPVGMNVFVLRSMLPEVPTGAIWRGVMPFVLVDLVRLGLLIALPAITLWLPQALRL